MNNFLAIDLGATSGRAIVGSLLNGKLALREVRRFPNKLIEAHGHFYWNIFSLFDEIVGSLKAVRSQGITVASIGIDTWGVDFACVGSDGEFLGHPYSYRDPQTTGEPERFFNVVPRERVYDITGIQFMDFNSLFQLSALRRRRSSALAHAEKILFVPDALSYLLTNQMVTEYTIASTSQLLNVRTRELSDELLAAVGLSQGNFGRFVLPGTKIGVLTENLQLATGLGPVPVVAVGGHDTASAVAAVPAADRRFAYLSSGTWSLMGIEVDSPICTRASFEKNFTNEGAIAGNIRFLKNICGMWLLEQSRKEFRTTDYDVLDELSTRMPRFRSLINPDASCFHNPRSMVAAIQRYCEITKQNVPKSEGEIVRCIYESLAFRYRQVFGDLKKLAPFPIERIHVIGGGSRNRLLNQFAANAIGVSVVAGPTEATALGNLLVQAKAAGAIRDIREAVRRSVDVVKYEPRDAADWNSAYKHYLSNFREI
jgi:rhamnulokinase